MGAWGPGPFDNDGALDLVGDLRGGTPNAIRERIRDVLAAVLDADGYIEAATMEVALAAAALVAIRAGGPQPSSSPAVVEWLEEAPFGIDEEERGLAIAVIDRAADAGDNEWFDLWAESGAQEEARAALEPYRRALVEPSG